MGRATSYAVEPEDGVGEFDRLLGVAADEGADQFVERGAELGPALLVPDVVGVLGEEGVGGAGLGRVNVGMSTAQLIVDGEGVVVESEAFALGFRFDAIGRKPLELGEGLLGGELGVFVGSRQLFGPLADGEQEGFGGGGVLDGGRQEFAEVEDCGGVGGVAALEGGELAGTELVDDAGERGVVGGGVLAEEVLGFWVSSLPT